MNTSIRRNAEKTTRKVELRRRSALCESNDPASPNLCARPTHPTEEGSYGGNEENDRAVGHIVFAMVTLLVYAV